jgi:hypothetical protein
MYGGDHLDGAGIVQPKKKTNVMIYFKTASSEDAHH